jgi:hypothetical protein
LDMQRQARKALAQRFERRARLAGRAHEALLSHPRSTGYAACAIEPISAQGWPSILDQPKALSPECRIALSQLDSRRDLSYTT